MHRTDSTTDSTAGAYFAGLGAAARAGGPSGTPHDVRVLLSAVTEAYERGWQPQDVLHVAVRDHREAVRPAFAAVLLAHAYALTDLAQAPAEWADQIRTLALSQPEADAAALRYAPLLDAEPACACPGCAGQEGHAARFAAALRSAARDGALRNPALGVPSPDALALLWMSLPEWPHLCPPPSQWGPHTAGARPGGPAGAVDRKVLFRIRALLAKAESTDYPEEAESLTAKAQELITRHRVDSALLQAGTPHTGVAVSARRVHLDNPYLKEKVSLLAVIGTVNTVRTVWSQRLAIATVIGAPAALEQVELLYTSLLVQATRAMRARSPRGGAPGRTAAFRRSFLMGFGVRIGERLRQAQRTAQREAAAEAGMDGAALVPVLRAQEDAVAREAHRLFPHTGTTRAGKVDAEGWVAGTDEADRATLTAGGTRLAGAGALPAAGN